MHTDLSAADLMLKGKIISIEYRGVLNWRLIIDGHRKDFTTFGKMESYIFKVMQFAKDEQKRQLLKEDMQKLWRDYH